MVMTKEEFLKHIEKNINNDLASSLCDGILCPKCPYYNVLIRTNHRCFFQEKPMDTHIERNEKMIEQIKIRKNLNQW